MIFKIWLIGVFFTFMISIIATVYINKQMNKTFKFPIFRVDFNKAVINSLLWPFYILWVLIEAIIEVRK